MDTKEGNGKWFGDDVWTSIEGGGGLFYLAGALFKGCVIGALFGTFQQTGGSVSRTHVRTPQRPSNIEHREKASIKIETTKKEGKKGIDTVTPLPVDMKIFPHNGCLHHHLSRRSHAPLPTFVPQRLDLFVRNVGF